MNEQGLLVSPHHKKRKKKKRKSHTAKELVPPADEADTEEGPVNEDGASWLTWACVCHVTTLSLLFRYVL